MPRSGKILAVKTLWGTAAEENAATIFRVVRTDEEAVGFDPQLCARVVSASEWQRLVAGQKVSFSTYGALVLEGKSLERLSEALAESTLQRSLSWSVDSADVPLCFGVAAGEFVTGDVISVDTAHERVLFLYEVNSGTNALYLTDLCNSHCLMCPQPPKAEDGVTKEALLRTIACLPNDLPYLGLTGGEPTVVEETFFSVLKALKDRFPTTEMHLLSNARKFSDAAFVQRFAKVRPAGLSVGVPLYASSAQLHDFIVQAKGAFDEAVLGMMNLAKLGVPVEVRVVLHKQTIPGLLELVDFLYHNLPFVYHIALMGMEHMGYVKRHWDELWISPVDYQEVLLSAVQYLHRRGMSVSIYNLPLCLTNRRLWTFTRDSISTFKKAYAKECEGCTLVNRCPGLFHYQAGKMPVVPVKDVHWCAGSSDAEAVENSSQ